MTVLQIISTKIIRLFFIILFLLFFCIKICFAHHGGECNVSGPGLSGPIITIPAYTLPKGEKYFGTGINYTNFNTFSSSKLINLDNRGEHVHDTGNLFIPSLSGGYGVTDNFYLSLNLPYIFRYSIRTAENDMVFNEGDSIGIGDLTLFSAYKFLRKDDIGLNVSFLSGIKIPSGVRRDKDKQGFIFEADDQPSTGSWDPLIGLAVTKKIGVFALHSNGLYRFSTRGTQNTIVGDVVTFNLAASHRVYKNKFLSSIFLQQLFNKDLNWDLILEANGQWVEKPRTRASVGSRHIDFTQENHGGLLIHLTPGLRLIVDKRWVTNIGIGIPILKDLNGRERAPSARLVFGLYRVF